MMPFDSFIFMSLLTAHLIGDFVLQTRYDVMHKARLPVLIKHASTIAVLSWVFTGSLGLWFILPWIGITHGATDYVKAKYGDMIGNPFNTFLIDQFVHILVIAVTAVAVPAMLMYESAWMVMFEGIYMQAMYITCGVVMAVRVGGIVIGIWISPMTDFLEPAAKERMERSGKVIGELERLLIFFFVFIGLFNLIGFLLAAKAIFRIGTLISSERKNETEYIIVGTLISFTWALIFAWLTQYLLLYPGW
jgi:hypothetical protein